MKKNKNKIGETKMKNHTHDLSRKQKRQMI